MGEWTFDHDDVIVRENDTRSATTLYRVKKRLTDEDGERFYHTAIRYPFTHRPVEAEVYGDTLLGAETVESEYRLSYGHQP